MRIQKALQLSLNMLVHSKLRSWLTIIGIVIGIAAVVSIISVSEGAKQTLESQFSSLGANILTVNPGFSRAAGAEGNFRGGDFGGQGSTSTQKNLTSKDIATIRGVVNVKYVLGTISKRVDATYLAKSATLNVEGVDPAIWKNFETTDLQAGRYLTNGDTDAVVVGYSIANRVFSDLELNRQIVIGSQTFRVVGILQQSGGGDSQVYMPITQARIVMDKVGQDQFDSISVEINDVNQVNDTINTLTNRLMMARGILQSKDQDFTVTSPTAMQQRITSALTSVSLFLAAIAAISLIVGAVGIANSMFTSVLEKTKDIGIMKAIGAKNIDIMLIFLFNSSLLGFVGGIGGIILGVIGSSAVSGLGSSGTLGRISLSNAYFSPTLIIGAFLLSIIIGMIAGVVPAYRASRLRPVDALRYE